MRSLTSVALAGLGRCGGAMSLPVAAEVVGGAWSSRWSRARRLSTALVALTKPRIVELLLITTVPTMILAYHGFPPAALLGSTVAGGALSAAGANVLNMVYDRDIDAVMSRTKRRPLVTGEVSPGAALVFGLALEVGAFVLLDSEVNLLAACLAVGAAAFYVGIYTMVLKRHTRHNIVIGGAAGAAPVLVAWAAVTGHLGLVAWLLFALIFLWTPPHFWALAVRYRDDYGSAHVPMLPVVADLRGVANQMVGYALALCALGIALVPAARLGPVFAVTAGTLGIGFVAKAWQLRSDPSPERAMGVFHYSITYLSAVFVMLAVSVFLGKL